MIKKSFFAGLLNLDNFADFVDDGANILLRIGPRKKKIIFVATFLFFMFAPVPGCSFYLYHQTVLLHILSVLQ